MPDYKLYLPRKGDTPYPLIIILPILGQLLFFKDLCIERLIARFFSKRGFAAAILCRNFFAYNPEKGIEQVGNYLARAVRQAQHTLDDLAKNRAIDASRMGSLGISFGGILSVLLAAQEPRLKASVIALAGGNIPEIIATSRDPLLSDYREQLLEGLQLTPEAFVEKLKNELMEEPLKIAGKLEPENILMVIARWDRVVLPRYALALREALRKPKTIFLPLGHYFTILIMAYLNRRALAFFKEKLLPVSDPGV